MLTPFFLVSGLEDSGKQTGRQRASEFIQKKRARKRKGQSGGYVFKFSHGVIPLALSA